MQVSIFSVIFTLTQVQIQCHHMAVKNKLMSNESNNYAPAPVFRPDYKLIADKGFFVKIHTHERTWSEARSYCSYEGASLAVFSSELESKNLKQILLHALTIDQKTAWIGVHDLFAEGEFVTTEGDPISKVYNKWAIGEPNNAGDAEDCVAINRDGLLNDEKCTIRLPFICKKDLTELTVNPECDTYDLGYRLIPEEGICLKLHHSPKSWAEAYLICRAEQAQMSVITSIERATVLANEFAMVPKDSLKGKFRKDIVLIGFHDKFTNGDFLTIEGKTLAETGYDMWAPHQPDNANGREHCGSMKRSGLLDDVDCAVRAMFFCDKDVMKRNNSIMYAPYMQYVN